MGRDPRYIPPNSLQHIVDVTFQNRAFFAPSKQVDELVVGILGKAQERYGMIVCAVVVMSTHIHYLLHPKDGAQLASFMCFVKTNLSKEIGRLRGWRGSIFRDRYHSTTVSTEERAQIRVLQYILSHGPKEHLVDRVSDWPGVHSAAATLAGQPMEGVWFDRTAERKAWTRKRRSSAELEFAMKQRLELSPLPCLQHLSKQQWRAAVEAVVEQIDTEAAECRQLAKKRSLGIAKVLATDPMGSSEVVNRSPKPRFHASDSRVLKAMLEIWREVVAAFRDASKKLRAGFRAVEFPEGTFPPCSPFVPFSELTLSALSRENPF